VQRPGADLELYSIFEDIQHELNSPIEFLEEEFSGAEGFAGGFIGIAHSK